MKKKLIAIVASLAMVATMVPATAFAAGVTPSPAKADLKKLTATFTPNGALETAYKAMIGAGTGGGNLDNLMFAEAGSTVIVTGALPYRTLEAYSTTKNLQTGHFLGVQIDGTDGTAATTDDLSNWVLKTPATHTTGNKTLHTTDLLKIAKNEILIARLDKASKKTYDLFALSSYGTLKKNNWYGSVSDSDLPNTTDYAAGTTKALNDWLEDKTPIKVTLDTTNLTLLSKEDTEQLEEFVEIVNEIGAVDVEITNTYKRHVANAERAYAELTDAQKNIIKDTVLQSGEKNYKKAYETLEAAKQKVAGDALVNKVIEEIDALPTLPTTAFTDKAAIDAVFVPMTAATKDYEALTKAQKEAVDTETGNKLETYKTGYDKLIKAYVDPIYAKAAAIDLEKPLTDADVALITELKGFVDGKYIDTANIDAFKQATYDALIAALDKVEKDAKSLANAEVTVAGADSIVYDGTKKTPELTVTISGKEVPAEAYDTIYSDNKDAGEAIVTIIPKDESGYTGKKEATFTIKAATLTDAMVKSVANATYTGTAVTPAVTVDKGVTYEVTYKNNTAVGTATAVITGTGNYSGEITKNFIVKPAKEAISSLKAGKKSLTVAYNAQTGAKYRIVYSPAKGQAKAVNTTATKKTIKNLKAGKTYKVKVRAYKTIDGTTYNGTYSTVKKVKVK